MTAWRTVIHSRQLPDNPHQIHLDMVRLHEGAPESPRILWAMPAPGVLIVQGSTSITPGWVYQDVTASESQPVPLTWATGDRVRFGLIGNPTRGGGSNRVTIRPDGRPRHPGTRKRGPLRGAERDEWMHRKLGDMFTDIDMVGRELGPAIARKPGHPPRTHTRHLWQGTATVTDPDVLRTAILAGMGHGKAHGCGLLIVTSEAA